VGFASLWALLTCDNLMLKRAIREQSAVRSFSTYCQGQCEGIFEARFAYRFEVFDLFHEYVFASSYRLTQIRTSRNTDLSHTELLQDKVQQPTSTRSGSNKWSS
jgi:hypothetical protein